MSMKQSILKYGVLGAGTLFCFASFGFGQTLTFNGPANANAQVNGDYADPYLLSVNGATPSILAMCDDFADTIIAGESWGVNTTLLSQFSDTNAAPVANVKFDTLPSTMAGAAAQTNAYIAAAILSVDALTDYNAFVADTAAHNTAAATNDTNAQDAATSALWNLFDSNAGLVGNGSTLQSDALTTAALFTNGQAWENASGYDATIYTYNNGGVNCGAGGPTSCTPPPQEFITLTYVDEPPAPAILGFYMLCASTLVWFLRRRMSRSA